MWYIETASTIQHENLSARCLFLSTKFPVFASDITVAQGCSRVWVFWRRDCTLMIPCEVTGITSISLTKGLRWSTLIVINKTGSELAFSLFNLLAAEAKVKGLGWGSIYSTCFTSIITYFALCKFCSHCFVFSLVFLYPHVKLALHDSIPPGKGRDVCFYFYFPFIPKPVIPDSIKGFGGIIAGLYPPTDPPEWMLPSGRGGECFTACCPQDADP